MAERRPDPTNPPGSKKTYTRQQFVDFYGAEQAAGMWRRAGGTASAGTERRRDPTTKSQKTYTRAQFNEFYGPRRGAEVWRGAAECVSSGSTTVAKKAAKKVKGGDGSPKRVGRRKKRADYLAMPKKGLLEHCFKEFPTAWRNPDLEDVMFKTLKKHGFTAKNTLFAHSTCPDEVNYDEPETDLVGLMHKRWGEKFTLGGLAGFPFAGRTGWGAFSAHTPEDGHIVLLYAPHVGIGSDGKLGRLKREGQSKDSTCCGAAVAAYSTAEMGVPRVLSNFSEGQKVVHESRGDGVVKSIADGAVTVAFASDSHTYQGHSLKEGKLQPKENSESAPIDQYDPQQCIIVQKIAKWKRLVSKDADPDRALVYANFHAAREYLRAILSHPEKVCKKLAVVGGIMVNLPDPWEDHFVPLTFDVLDCAAGTVEDVCEEVFGPRPPSAAALGGEGSKFNVLPLP